MFEIYIHYYRYDTIENYPDIFTIQYDINNIDYSGILLFANYSMQKPICLDNLNFIKYVVICHVFYCTKIFKYMILPKEKFQLLI